MKKQAKHVVTAAVTERRSGAAECSRETLLADLQLDPASVELFAEIHANKEFTIEAAYKAFADVRRKD